MSQEEIRQDIGQENINDPQQNMSDEVEFADENDEPEYEQQGEIYNDDVEECHQQAQFLETNEQHSMEDLLKLISKQNNDISQKTNFSPQWSMLLFYSCEWNSRLCLSQIDQKNSHKEMIKYNKIFKDIQRNSFKKLPVDVCMVCGLQEIILQNLCGCQFCIYCWSNHIESRIKNFNDPLPPCMEENCLGRVSYLLALELGKTNKPFNQLFNKTICRSYAQNNKFVRMCWSDNCSNCFNVKKPFQLTQCDKCMNFICLLCGKQHHLPGDCFNQIMWRKLSQSSLDFIKQFGYRVCPKCKQAVDRFSGCNFMTCRCKNNFCYICGENWEPNHKQHGICYKPTLTKQQNSNIIENALKQLNSTVKHIENHRKLIEKNKQSYKVTLKQAQAQVFRYDSLLKKVKNINTQKIKQQLYQVCKIYNNQVYFLSYWTKILHIGYLYCKNSIITQFIEPNQLLAIHTNKLSQNLDQIQLFILEVIPNVILFTKDPDTLILKKDIQKLQKYREMPLKQYEIRKKSCLIAVHNCEKFLQLKQVNKYN